MKKAKKDEEKPLKPWGIALKAVLKDRKISQNAMVKLADKDNSEFYRACRGERGPGPQQIDKYLNAMKANWHDFADKYEAVKRGEIIEIDGKVFDTDEISQKILNKGSPPKPLSKGA